MQSRNAAHDVVVVGGGLAGTVAAVAAARLGSRVALVTNRPVLGGNSSSEIRVWVVGATAHGTQRFARETGIMGELFLENQYRNPQGNAIYWDQVVLDLVRAEPNISLHLSTDVRTVTMAADDPTRIASVTGWTMGSEIETVFSAPVFLDCTGDGLVGALAGAEHRIGREGRAEHGEPWAPEQPDDELLGSSIFFSTHDTGKPERFVPPSIARDISRTPILANRSIRTGDKGCAYWWIEWGGELDTVTDNERIRDELWSVVYGIWDHIKNSGEFQADTLTLDWVGAIPGKREYRRFVGDHTLTQQDLLEQRSFPDTVAFGGWSIDLHPVQGVYAETAGAQQRYTDGTYEIPFRSLYSRTVPNLLLAGRDISASHVAFGSTRVMATCATQGQAAGTAAHLVARHGLTPRALGSTHTRLLQQTLLRQDAPLIGVRADDEADLAPRATVTASSERTVLGTLEHLPAGRPDGGAGPTGPDGGAEPAGPDVFPLDRDLGVLLPVDPRLDTVRLRTRAEHATTLTAELWTTGKPQNYVPLHHERTVTAQVPAGEGETLLTLGWTPERPGNVVLVLRAAPGVALPLTDGHPYGVQLMQARTAGDAAFDAHIPDEADQAVTDWQARPLRGRSVALVAEPASDAWRATRVVDGYQRPYGGPHLWSSTPGALDDGPVDLTLTWDAPVDVHEVRLVLNDDVDADLINLHHHRTRWDAVPDLVRDYTLDVRTAEGWRPVAEVTGNRHRHRVHTLAEPVRADALRLRVTATNGSPAVTVCAVKVY
jgi:hypothetical protein